MASSLLQAVCLTSVTVRSHTRPECPTPSSRSASSPSKARLSRSTGPLFSESSPTTISSSFSFSSIHTGSMHVPLSPLNLNKTSLQLALCRQAAGLAQHYRSTVVSCAGRSQPIPGFFQARGALEPTIATLRPTIFRHWHTA